MVSKLAILLLGLTLHQEPDLSSPEATIRSFLTAFSRPDFALAVRHVEGLVLSPMTRDWEKSLRESRPRFKLTDTKVHRRSGDIVRATCKVFLDESGGKHLETTVVDLRRIGDKWLIIRPDRRDPTVRGDLIRQVLVVLEDPSVGAAWFGSGSKPMVCISNLKQVALASLLFLTDNKDRYQFSNTNMVAKLNPYIKNLKTFDCPQHKGKGQSYSFNGALAGKSQSTLSEPAWTVLFYEGSNGKLDFSRHNGYACVALCDGSARVIKKGSEQRLRWKP